MEIYIGDFHGWRCPDAAVGILQVGVYLLSARDVFFWQRRKLGICSFCLGTMAMCAEAWRHGSGALIQLSMPRSLGL
jgi:hypothetical protein